MVFLGIQATLLCVCSHKMFVSPVKDTIQLLLVIMMNDCTVYILVICSFLTQHEKVHRRLFVMLCSKRTYYKNIRCEGMDI